MNEIDKERNSIFITDPKIEMLINRYNEQFCILNCYPYLSIPLLMNKRLHCKGIFITYKTVLIMYEC